MKLGKERAVEDRTNDKDLDCEYIDRNDSR